MYKKSHFILLIFCYSLIAQPKKFEKNVERFMISSWLTLSASALASRCSTTIRNFIFGSQDTPPRVKKIAQPLIDATNKTVGLKQSRNCWSSFLGNAFASDQTVFLSKKACEHPKLLQQTENKKLLAKAIADSATNRDLKITCAGIAIPVAVFSSLTLYEQYMKKHSDKKPNFYQWHKYLFGIHSFKTKALASLVLFWGYIKYVDYQTAKEAAKLLAL